MTYTIEYQSMTGKGNIDIDKLPDECPICKKGSQFKRIYAYWKEGGFGSGRLQIVFRCPRQECQVLFFGVYTNPYSRMPDTVFLNQVGLFEAVEPTEFPEPIPTLSKRFVSVYFQAEIADKNGLDEVRGLAYGKALEILIKDYLIHLEPSKEAEIKNEYRFGNLLPKIKDPDIHDMAKRAAWLRNDEAHYTRQFEKQDVEDLKILIELTVQHIRRALLTGKYRTEMPDPKENA